MELKFNEISLSFNMIIVCILNDKEISLNFKSIYLILRRPSAEIVGSNPAGGMDVCLL
jgi:hypothetical protein